MLIKHKFYSIKGSKDELIEFATFVINYVLILLNTVISFLFERSKSESQNQEKIEENNAVVKKTLSQRFPFFALSNFGSLSR